MDCMVFDTIFNHISVTSRQSVHLSIVSWSILTSTPYSILSKPLAAFSHNHCGNNWQLWERNESCSNDYHQSSERIFAEPGIEPTTCFSEVCNATNWAMGLGPWKEEGTFYSALFCLFRLLIWSSPKSCHWKCVKKQWMVLYIQQSRNNSQQHCPKRKRTISRRWILCKGEFFCLVFSSVFLPPTGQNFRFAHVQL